MNLHIYNSFTYSITPFFPQKPGHAGIYVCGPTAYDHAHIGHARSAVFFDVVVRYLRFRGFKVVYVRNITDIDDKIIEKSGIENKSFLEIAKKYINSYHSDMELLGVQKPDYEPRATQYIPVIIKAISDLIDINSAYVRKGNVWFRTGILPNYGILSGRTDIQEDTSGYRVAVTSDKEDSRDFALWKKSEPGSPSWESPWGKGRPGWHIECAVMSNALLGTTFDIHGGGRDLIFPHHENERAISLALTKHEPAKYWIHHALVTVNGKKLSKSDGSGFSYLIRDLCKKYRPEAIRLLLLSTYYRRQLDVTGKRLAEKQAAIERLYGFIDKYKGALSVEKVTGNNSGLLLQRFCKAMDNDFNIPEGIGVLFEEVRRLKRKINLAGDLDALSPSDLEDFRYLLLIFKSVIGISFGDACNVF